MLCTLIHRLRCPGEGERCSDVLRPLKLLEKMPSQPPSRRVARGLVLASAFAMPCSRSTFLSLSAEPDPEASASSSSSSSSSSLSSRYGSYRGPFPLPRCSDRTTSPLQMGHVRRRVVSQGVMQSAWNSWPHGKLITLLTPSTYSSRHTTHSTCRPIYFLHSAENPPAPFSNPDRRFVPDGSCGAGIIAVLGARKLGLSMTPVVVLERGRDRDGPCCSRGVMGVAIVGEGSLGDRLDVVDETV